MAALDFPTSPALGQNFVGGNGVNYQWNGSLWLSTGQFTSAGGDFCAVQTSAFLGLTSSNATLVFTQVISGNSGGWYSTSTGRYTPPAGRYKLTGGYSGLNTTSASSFFLQLRKNGVIVMAAGDTSAGTNNYANPEVEAIVDANGTDWFDIQGSSSAGASNTFIEQHFMAFPISGIKGPPGDPGQLGFRLLQRTAVSSAVPDVSIQGISSDINDLQFAFDLTPVTNAQDLVMQFYDAGGALVNAASSYASVTTTAFATMNALAPAAMGSGPSTVTSGIALTYSTVNRRAGNSTGIRGSGTLTNIRASRVQSVNFQTDYVSDDATQSMFCTGGGVRNAVGAITGFRLVFGSGNVASGAFSVWGSP